MQKLLVIWQSPLTRKWHPVAVLNYTLNQYIFRYVNGAEVAIQEGFNLVYGFPNLEATYLSEKLPSFFKNRLLNRSRNDFEKYLEWVNIHNATEHNDMDLLAWTFGRKHTDDYILFKCPEPVEGEYRITFFIHGVRYRKEVDYQELRRSKKRSLILEHEANNEFDENAILLGVQDDGLFDRKYLGYVPEFLSEDIRYLMNHTYVTAEIVKINPPPVPYWYRCLVSLKSPWPSGFESFKGKRFTRAFAGNSAVNSEIPSLPFAVEAHR